MMIKTKMMKMKINMMKTKMKQIYERMEVISMIQRLRMMNPMVKPEVVEAEDPPISY